MKILQVFDFFSMPLGGGTVDLVSKLSRALAQHGHEVEIYTSDSKIDHYHLASLPEVSVQPFRCISSLAAFYVMPGIIPALRDNLKGFDIVHLHSARSFQNVIVHHYARKYNIPYVLDTHGTLPRTVQGRKGFKQLLKWKFDIAFGNRILRDASKVVAETQVGVNEYLAFRVEPDRIVLIQPPFDTEAFTQLPPRGNFRGRYDIQHEKIIMFLGRIHWIKGIDFLVASFAELARSRDDIRLVIVGNDDGYQTTLEEMIASLGIADRVLFTGFLSGEDKLSALVDAEVVVQTSRYEQGAWAPFEAVLCGTPIIVSSNSGAGEDVQKIDAGYLVEFDNKIDLREKMRYVIDHQDKARNKTAKAKLYIETNLSLAENVKKYEELYESILNKEA